MIYKYRNSLTFRITIWYTTAFVAFLIIALLSSYFLIQKNLNDEVNNDLKSDILEYKSLYNEGGIKQVIGEIQRDLKPEDINDEFIQIIDADYNIIFTTDLSYWKGLETSRNLVNSIFDSKYGTEISLNTIEIPNREFGVRTAYGRIGTDRIIIIGETLELSEEIMELLLILFIVMFLVVTPLASAIVWFVAHHAVSGIKEVSDAATAIKNGNFEHRVNVNNQSDEIHNLADTFNSMADRIKELITEMREMIDNIAHDLRSPLSRIRAISEMIISSNNNSLDCKTAASDTLEQCDRLLQYINSTLDVAEAESGVGLIANEKINLSRLSEDACDLFEPVAEEKRIVMKVKIEPDCEIAGNKQNIQRMIANILDNAMKYTPPDGRISFKLEKKSSVINITISDTGIGIPQDEQQRVFDRFYRCDRSRSEEGCGLGLSFARAVARSHGGNIYLSSIPGEYCTFVIELPLQFLSV